MMFDCKQGGLNMKNDVHIVNIMASVLIVLVMGAYFTLKANQNNSDSAMPINIVLNSNGYQPALIQVASGQEVKLRVVRTNVEACKTSIEFPQFNTAYPFMLDIPVNITLPPQPPGIIDFACQGGPAHGRIVVV
jgi:plastocyanin domain-containing protein